METTILDEIRDLKSLLLDRFYDRWLNIKEVCRYTSLSESTIRRNVRKGTLKASHRTGKLLFNYKDINNWLNG